MDKTFAEIEAEKPPERIPVLFEQQKAYITNKQYQSLLDRISNLEK